MLNKSKAFLLIILMILVFGTLSCVKKRGPGDSYYGYRGDLSGIFDRWYELFYQHATCNNTDFERSGKDIALYQDNGYTYLVRFSENRVIYRQYHINLPKDRYCEISADARIQKRREDELEIRFGDPVSRTCEFRDGPPMRVEFEGRKTAYIRVLSDEQITVKGDSPLPFGCTDVYAVYVVANPDRGPSYYAQAVKVKPKRALTADEKKFFPPLPIR